MNSHLEQVAAILRKNAHELQELDEWPLHFAYHPGRYITSIVRDQTTGDVHEITLNLDTGESVELAHLRQLDRQSATEQGGTLTSDLLELVLRHPELEQVDVRVQISTAAGIQDKDNATPGQDVINRLIAELYQLGVPVSSSTLTDEFALELTLSVRQIVRIGTSRLIESVELAAEPIILDEIAD